MEFTTITEVLKNIRTKKISVEELNKIFIQRIKDNQNLNAFIYFAHFLHAVSTCFFHISTLFYTF